ncbi:MAG: hypothetical protein QME50_06170 [Candidatus Bathyarchaeota archaeon]|nr:hypothetical protein [Candidatus Bathyarchaeota archaeon]
MLFSEYLHEKAEESRHNETVGYLIIIIGSIGLVLLLAGIMISVHYTKERGWYMKEIHKAHSVEEKTKNPKEIKFRTRVKNKEKESLAISP